MRKKGHWCLDNNTIYRDTPCVYIYTYGCVCVCVDFLKTCDIVIVSSQSYMNDFIVKSVCE